MGEEMGSLFRGVWYETERMKMRQDDYLRREMETRGEYRTKSVFYQSSFGVVDVMVDQDADSAQQVVIWGIFL